MIFHYAKPVAATHWLCEAFGFETTTSLPDKDSEQFTWIEIRIGNGAITVRRSSSRSSITGSRHVSQTISRVVDGPSLRPNQRLPEATAVGSRS